jgi:flavoprotein
MKKLIGFILLKRQRKICEHCTRACTKKTCPTWAWLDAPQPTWTMAVLCRKCVHSSPDDQICEHTGWDKRTLKECPYIMEEK